MSLPGCDLFEHALTEAATATGSPEEQQCLAPSEVKTIILSAGYIITVASSLIPAVTCTKGRTDRGEIFKRAFVRAAGGMLRREIVITSTIV